VALAVSTVAPSASLKSSELKCFENRRLEECFKNENPLFQLGNYSPGKRFSP